jgi:hypothetical protein
MPSVSFVRFFLLIAPSSSANDFLFPPTVIGK